MEVWKAGNEVAELIDKVQKRFHKHLEDARIACIFNDSQSFVKNRFNWGKVTRFSPVAKLFQDEKHDFLITLCSDAWASVLNQGQREALIDLHLCCCKVEMKPVIVQENKKKKMVRDQWGRVQFTDEMFFDEDGNPKWTVLRLDLNVFMDNVSHYGCWCQDLLDFRSVIREIDSREAQ